MTRWTHDSDPTPPHGTERPVITETPALAVMRADMEAEAMQRMIDRNARRRPQHTWTDVTRLIAGLDAAAVAAGHPATYGTLHLVTPEAPGDHARIERRGSTDRVPGGSILSTDATTSHAMLTTRLELYHDLTDASHEQYARIYDLNRKDKR